MIQRTSAMTSQSYWRISQEIFLMINKYNKIPLHCSIKQTANVLQTENTADSKHSVPKHTTPLLVKSISRLENWISIIWQFNKSLDTPVTCLLCNKECLFYQVLLILIRLTCNFTNNLKYTSETSGLSVSRPYFACQEIICIFFMKFGEYHFNKSLCRFDMFHQITGKGAWTLPTLLTKMYS